ncbi:fatty-acyl-CoA synthase [Desulfosalsimonas propionicica]|uniref:Fatty-acyl-CoA synthase n=1 Tax=Desulfosalsimonas propionicica TaxID=332175 RepID=A0A7W0CC12_9BACT|nr:acyl-CoA synthetase [Desulfosalsimonas propionicica]MBA2882988.1 fatty-acyl-CoA synthase [Desulfosalsimonas propionicica]
MSHLGLIRGLKDIEEIEKVPWTDRIKEKNTVELIENGARTNPEATAISFLESGDSFESPMRIAFKDLMGRIRQTANMLYDLGIGPKDVVSYVLPNLPQTHYVLWGAEAAGIANPINPLLEPAAIRDICVSVQTRVLVCLGETEGNDIWEKVNAIRKEIPTLKFVVQVMGSTDKAENIIGFDEMLESYPSDQYIFTRPIKPEDIASIYHTGGTTGTPKLAMRTHCNEVIMAYDLRIMAGFNTGSTLLCGLPLFHCNGTIVTGLAPFAAGGQVVMLSPMGYRDPSIIKNFFKIVEKFQAESFSAVPTILSSLLELPIGDADISSLKYVICGAAPLSQELFRRIESRTGMKILEGYGLTEGAVASAFNPKDGERKVGSVGIRMPYQSVKIAILDENGNYIREGKCGEIGAVTIKGPNVFNGYLEESHNQGVWMPDGSFSTGDLGRIDEDGYLWLTGRKKELIIRGGHNIDPAAIEEPLFQMPNVRQVAAVGRPDPYAGEVPVAYVEMADGVDMDENQIMQWARENIGERAAVPKEVIIIPSMPLTPVGKIFKPALRWDATRRVYEKELKQLDGIAEILRIDVVEDNSHGIKVTISVEPAADHGMDTIKQRINELLSKYTVFYEIEKAS